MGAAGAAGAFSNGEAHAAPGRRRGAARQRGGRACTARLHGPPPQCGIASTAACPDRRAARMARPPPGQRVGRAGAVRSTPPVAGACAGRSAAGPGPWTAHPVPYHPPSAAPRPCPRACCPAAAGPGDLSAPCGCTLPGQGRRGQRGHRDDSGLHAVAAARRARGRRGQGVRGSAGRQRGWARAPHHRCAGARRPPEARRRRAHAPLPCQPIAVPLLPSIPHPKTLPPPPCVSAIWGPPEPHQTRVGRSQVAAAHETFPGPRRGAGAGPGVAR
jgi:hypothetical protein